jgi:hypothetical protein
MITTIVVLSIVLSVTGWLAYVQVRKVLKLTAYLELYTRMMLVTAVKVDRAHKRMKEVDRLGSFEADDETGMIFSEVKEATTELNEFIKRYINNGDEDGSEEKEKK